jgi:hypothetical protein
MSRKRPHDADWPFDVFTQKKFDPRYVVENSSGQKYDVRELAKYANNLRFGPVDPNVGRVAPMWPLLGTPMSDDDVLRVENRALRLGWRSKFAPQRVAEMHRTMAAMVDILKQLDRKDYDEAWLLGLRQTGSPGVRRLHELGRALDDMLPNLRGIVGSMRSQRRSLPRKSPSQAQGGSHVVTKRLLDECLLLAIDLGDVRAARELLGAGADPGKTAALVRACHTFTVPYLRTHAYRSYGTSGYRSYFGTRSYTQGSGRVLLNIQDFEMIQENLVPRVLERIAQTRTEMIGALIDASNVDAPTTNDDIRLVLPGGVEKRIAQTALMVLMRHLTNFPTGSEWDVASARALINRSARAQHPDAFLMALQGSIIMDDMEQEVSRLPPHHGPHRHPGDDLLLHVSQQLSRSTLASARNVFRDIMVHLKHAGTNVDDATSNRLPLLRHVLHAPTIYYRTVIHHVKLLYDLGSRVDPNTALKYLLEPRGTSPFNRFVERTFDTSRVAMFLLEMGARLTASQAESDVFFWALERALEKGHRAEARMLVRSGVPLPAYWANRAQFVFR